MGESSPAAGSLLMGDEEQLLRMLPAGHVLQIIQDDGSVQYIESPQAVIQHSNGNASCRAPM